MSERFGRWLRGIVGTAPAESSIVDVDLRDLVVQARARRDRRRAQRVLPTVVAVFACLTLLAATPKPIGSSRPGLFYEKTLPDGRYQYFDPISKERVRVTTLEEGELWSRIKERTAANQETIVSAHFWRFRRCEEYSIGYVQFDSETNELIDDRSRTANSPPGRWNKEDADLLAHTLTDSVTYETYISGPGNPLPDERILVDGYWFRFKVRSFDVPGVGTIIRGDGTPE